MGWRDQTNTRKTERVSEPAASVSNRAQCTHVQQRSVHERRRAAVVEVTANSADMASKPGAVEEAVVIESSEDEEVFELPKMGRMAPGRVQGT